MGHDRAPRIPPAISIRECQQAIEIAGDIKILLRGEEQLITEARTGGGGNTRWGREYPVVQRRSSLHSIRAAPTHLAGEGHY